MSNLGDGANELTWGPTRNVIGKIFVRIFLLLEKDVHELVAVATVDLTHKGTVRAAVLGPLAMIQNSAKHALSPHTLSPGGLSHVDLRSAPGRREGWGEEGEALQDSLHHGKKIETMTIPQLTSNQRKLNNVTTYGVTRLATMGPTSINETLR